MPEPPPMVVKRPSRRKAPPDAATVAVRDPERDIKRNTAGVLELTGNKPGLKRDLWRYFRQRNEDATTL